MAASPRTPSEQRPRLLAPAVIAVLAVGLRLASGVGFANYDTLYALVWGAQLSRGETPQYGIPVAPTPHPLVEALGLILSPLGPRSTEDVTVALGYLALAGCGWVVFALGERWFGRAAGVLAALILLTRVPVLSYGVRAYVDVPYMLLVLSALLVESRQRRSGSRVLVLLGLAGLLRPEAWVFAGLYWCYLWPAFGRSEMARLALLAAAAPLLWVISDALITGQPLWSLTNTRHTATSLRRITGIAHVPLYIPRRIGEILQPPVLLGAALGGALSLYWLRDRARLLAGAGVIAVAVFAVFATAGLPINTRYAFLISAILCIFCGAGVFGWTLMEAGTRRRRAWCVASAVVVVALLAYLPTQYRGAHRELENLARQQTIGNDLLGLVGRGVIGLRCGPVGVPNHALVPLLALRMRAAPSRVVSAQERVISSGTYVAAATPEVSRDYVLDPRDPAARAVGVPAGFLASGGDPLWRVFTRCGGR